VEQRAAPRVAREGTKETPPPPVDLSTRPMAPTCAESSEGALGAFVALETCLRRGSGVVQGLFDLRLSLSGLFWGGGGHAWVRFEGFGLSV
jgi:hypothetical protein